MERILDFKNFVLFEGNFSSSKSDLFDLNNKLVYRAIKDIRTATIGGKEYTFLCVGSGMKTYLKSLSNPGEEKEKVISKISEMQDKVLAFTPNGIYVITEAVTNGIITLASSIFSYVKEGNIKIGVSVIESLKKIDTYYKENGETPFNDIKDDSAEFSRRVITDLYKLSGTSSKTSEVISILVVGSYQASTSSFKTIPDFLNSCVYDTAKELNIRSVNIGQGIEDFYRVAKNTLNNLGVPINKTINNGIERITDIIKDELKKDYQEASKILDKESYTSMKKTQNRIFSDGNTLISKSKPIWDSFQGKKRSN